MPVVVVHGRSRWPKLGVIDGAVGVLGRVDVRRALVWSLVLAVGVALGWLLAPRSPPMPSTGRTAVPAQSQLAQSPAAVTLEPLQELARLLSAGAFAEAAQYLQTTRRRLAAEQGARLRAAFVSEARVREERGDALGAVAVLEHYLGVEHDDVAALELLAQLRQRLGDYGGALRALYDAHGFAASADRQAALAQRIREIAPRHRASLEAGGDHAAVAALFTDLLSLEPDYAPYLVGLAEAQLALGRVELAEATLRQLGHAPELEAQLAQRRAQLNAGSSVEASGTSVDLQTAGEHFLVETVLNGRHRVILLLDTGASTTLISAEALRAAGLWPQYPEAQVRLQTANGPMQVPLVRADAVSVGPQTVTNLKIGVWESNPPHGFHGLLGMDFLNRFDYVVDRRRAQLRFKASTP